jgi:hypothetical protein
MTTKRKRAKKTLKAVHYMTPIETSLVRLLSFGLAVCFALTLFSQNAIFLALEIGCFCMIMTELALRG